MRPPWSCPLVRPNEPGPSKSKSFHTALLTVHSLGERLHSWPRNWFVRFARTKPPGSAAVEAPPSMSDHLTVDREFLQTLFASAFTVQQSQMDSQSLSAIVEAERLIIDDGRWGI